MYVQYVWEINYLIKLSLHSVHLGSLDYHRASIQLQIDQLLFQVKERFSEVLLPAESITKLELSGKGNGQLPSVHTYISTYL